MITLNHYLILSGFLFSVGVAGVLLRRNALIVFMSVELMLNGVNLSLVAFANYLNSLDGRVFVFFIMAVAAAEVAVGLALIIVMFSHKQTVQVDRFNLLRW